MKNLCDKSDRVAIAVFICVAAVYMLIPMERGFNHLSVGGRMVRLGDIVAVLGFFALAWRRPFWACSLYSRMYIVPQVLLFVLMLLSVIRSGLWEAAWASTRQAITYFATWIVLYLVICQCVARIRQNILARVVCSIGILAAIVGIVEAIKGAPIGPWEYWSENYAMRSDVEFVERNYEDLFSAGSFRAGGTLGNPIVYSSMMIAVAVIGSWLPSGKFKHISISMAILASSLSISRTTLLISGVLAICWLRRGKLSNHVVTIIVLGSAVGSLIFAAAPGLAGFWADSWLQRIGVRDGAASDYAASGVEVRVDMAMRVFAETANSGILDILIGRGAQAATILAQRSLDISTVDNLYLTLFFEYGLLGLGLFLLSMLSFFRRGAISGEICLALLASGMTYVFYVYQTQSFVWLTALILGTLSVRRGNGVAIASHGRHVW